MRVFCERSVGGIVMDRHGDTNVDVMGDGTGRYGGDCGGGDCDSNGDVMPIHSTISMDQQR